MTRGLRSFLARYADDDRGNTAAIVAVCIVFLLGTAAMATDVGYVYFSKLKLQASADAAALAGATMIANGATTDPIVEATSYSAAAGDKNASNSYVAAMASGYPKLICSATLKNQADPCLTTFPNAPPAGANAIQVVENATVPSFFAKVFGVSHFTVSATSTAAARGGQPQPLDIEVILDTTASMGNSKDANCGLGGNAYRIDCAKYGLQVLLMALSPTVQYVGVLVFPGFPTTAQAKNDINCSGTTPTIDPYYGSAAYNPLTITNPIYQIAALNNDYKTSNTATSLKSSSNAAQAAADRLSTIPSPPGVPSCSGVSAPGGVGTYYAAAIAAAQADLVANGSPTAKHAIILLSDGEANATSAVIQVTVTKPGSLYNAAPTVKFSGGGGSGAAGTAVMAGSGSNQTVASVNITNIGSGYTSMPTVTFTPVPGKTGSGATGVPVLSPGLQQCQGAVAGAQTAKTAGTEIYTVAYGSSTDTSGSNSCQTDTAPTTTPCATLQSIASSLNDFYSDGSGGTACPNAQAVSNLASAFQSIASSITSVRLVPDSWFSST